MQQSDRTRIIISGGGTGGHIFPALAIADSLREKLPQADILFIGARGKMEMQKVPAHGYPIKGLPIRGFQRGKIWKNLDFPLKLAISLIKAWIIVRNFKPGVAIGTGGYASGPTLRVAAARGIPILIQEQNSFPGITNRLLGKYANRVCVAYPGMGKYFEKSKIVLAGNPVRKAIFKDPAKKNEGLAAFGLEAGLPVVLVVGGSQGAKAINETITNSLEVFVKHNIQLIWQTGSPYYPTACASIKDTNNHSIQVYDFITSMGLAYNTADVIVSRAGAIAISEICMVQKPVIFVPLPTAAEDHQTKNAQALVDKKAALLVKNSVAKDNLARQIIHLLNDKKLQQQLAENIGQFAFSNASEIITNEIITLVNQPEP